MRLAVRLLPCALALACAAESEPGDAPFDAGGDRSNASRDVSSEDRTPDAPDVVPDISVEGGRGNDAPPTSDGSSEARYWRVMYMISWFKQPPGE